MSRKYVVRIVVPARDYRRIASIVDELEERSQPFLRKRTPHFENRSDLDSLDIVFILDLNPREKKELTLKLSKALRKSLGFFLIFPL